MGHRWRARWPPQGHALVNGKVILVGPWAEDPARGRLRVALPAGGSHSLSKGWGCRQDSGAWRSRYGGGRRGSSLSIRHWGTVLSGGTLSDVALGTPKVCWRLGRTKVSTVNGDEGTAAGAVWGAAPPFCPPICVRGKGRSQSLSPSGGTWPPWQMLFPREPTEAAGSRACVPGAGCPRPPGPLYLGRGHPARWLSVRLCGQGLSTPQSPGRESPCTVGERGGRLGLESAP